MTIPVTATTAAILALLLIYLAVQVIKQRLRAKTAFGAIDDETFKMTHGAHANLAEHAPMALILMGALELAGANHTALMAIAIAFLIARGLHAFGMFHHQSSGQPKFRQAGVILTWLSMAAMALWIIYIAVMVNLAG